MVARLGKERIDETFDPSLALQRAIDTYRLKGYDEKWIVNRIKSLQERKTLTDVWKENGVTEAKEYAKKSSSYKTTQEYSQVFRKRLTSVLTNKFINDITLSLVTDNEIIKEHGTKPYQFELSLDKYKDLSKLLKTHIFNCVTRYPDITMYEAKGEIVIKSLFELFTDEHLNKGGKLLPPDFRPAYVNNYSLIQGSIDYIAGMMDTFAISEYERLFNVKFSDIVIKKL